MPKITSETFFRKVKLSSGSLPPIFNSDGINYFYIHRNSMYFVFTSMYNSSPSFMFELLEKTIRIIKDFLGCINEETIRKNFVLVYEILDEEIDWGYPQITSTELVKPYIVSEPILLTAQTINNSIFPTSFFSSDTKPSTATTQPISNDKKKNELYLDVLEKLTVVFNSNGYVINSSINGCIVMKSYLDGNPELKLVLNEDIAVGKNAAKTSIRSVTLDDCNFHESVNPKNFSSLKTLACVAPQGEFIVMNYRINSEFSPPFRIYPFIDELNNFKLQIIIKVRACYPEDHIGSFINVKFSVPRQTDGVNFDLPTTLLGQNAEYNPQAKIVTWTIKKFPGGKEFSLNAKISLESPTANMARNEIGPIGMTFEISNYNVSNISIKQLKVEEKDKTVQPQKFVRYVTQAGSYICRT